MEADLSVPASAPPPIPGYELLERIGEGGMGQVFRAMQHVPPRHVAVKILHAPLGGPVAQKEFLQECVLMASVAHPNIVAIYDFGEVQGRPYLVMELVSAPSLRTRMTPQQPWPIREAGVVLDAIARALSSMHERGILHLDLKPENVLGAVGGPIKLTDFGLARGNLDAGALPDRDLARGTIDYCSPEQWHGLPRDQRSDLFALATLAFELFTGRLPGRVYVSALRRNPALPAAIDPVLQRGLARDPDERFATVEEFRQALQAALDERRCA